MATRGRPPFDRSALRWQLLDAALRVLVMADVEADRQQRQISGEQGGLPRGEVTAAIKGLADGLAIREREVWERWTELRHPGTSGMIG